MTSFNAVVWSACLALGAAAPSLGASEVGTARIAYAGAPDWDAERDFFRSLTDEQVRDAVGEAIRNALRPSGLAAMVKAGDRIILKPNIVQAREGMGDITDIRVVRAVCAFSREAGAAQITVVESTLGAGRLAYHQAGYCTNPAPIDQHACLLAGIEDVPLVDLDAIDAGAAARIDDLSPKLFWGEVWLPDILRTRAQAEAGPEERKGVWCDVLISIAVLKNHTNAALTCGLKGRVGCAPMQIYGNRFSGTMSIHKDAAGRDCLNEAIVDLNRSRPSDLVVIDCLTGHTHGPSLFRVPSEDDLRRYIIFPFAFVASADAVAADVVAANLMGYDPSSVKYLALAGTHGLGSHQAKDIDTSGVPVADLRARIQARYGPSPFPEAYGSVNPSRLIRDLDPPVLVEITGPPAGTVAMGKVTVGVSASDGAGGSGIVRVELLLGEERVGVLRSDPAASLEGEIPWEPPAPGEYLLRAIAYDDFFNAASSAPAAISVVPYLPFLRGDANGDSRVDISDGVRLLFFLFLEGTPLPCPKAGDADDGGTIEITDVIQLLGVLFESAEPLPAPYPSCDEDLIPDALTCPASPCEGTP